MQLAEANHMAGPDAGSGEKCLSFDGKNFQVTSQGLQIQGEQGIGALLQSVYQDG